jgi:prepilin-type N-terminal cleavage/methylation domain-containing protein
MSKGMTLIEFVIVLLLGSLIMLSVSSVYIAVAWAYGSHRSDWVCMQSLRTAMLMLDRDIEECSYLLPHDLKVVYSGNKLFVAGLPLAADHKGLKINSSYAPPYYSIVSSENRNSIVLDTLDIDTDGKPDYIAGHGIISDSGAYEIINSYSRGHSPIPLKEGTPEPGDRTVPAVLYQVSGDGLYRNNQLVSENITGFSVKLTGSELNIIMRAKRNETAKEISFNYCLGE